MVAPQGRAALDEEKLRFLKYLFILYTHASLNVFFIAPSAVSLTINSLFVQTTTCVAPALLSTVVSNSRGIWPGVRPIDTGPVRHAQVILVHPEGGNSAIDG